MCAKMTFLRGFRHYRYQHRCHKAEQTKNNSASTRLHAILRACFAGHKRDANLKRVHDAENNLLFLPPWWFWRTSDLTLAIKEIRYVSHKRWKVCQEGASFNNLIPFKSSTEPLDKDDCIVEGRRIVELSEIVHQLQEGCRKCGTELRLILGIGPNICDFDFPPNYERK